MEEEERKRKQMVMGRGEGFGGEVVCPCRPVWCAHPAVRRGPHSTV